MSPVGHAILDHASDDFIGLWEVVRLVEEQFREKDSNAARRLAANEIRDLIQRHLLQLYIGVDFDGDEALIRGKDVDEMLSVETYWREPVDRLRHLRVVATEQGESAYLSND